MPPRKPKSKAAADRDALFAERGATAEALVEQAQSAVVEGRHYAITTKAVHERALSCFLSFANHLKDNLSIFPGPPSSPDDVLRQNAGPLDIGVMHAFMKYRIESSQGYIAERMTLRTAKAFVEKFASAYRIKTGSSIPRAVTLSTKNYLVNHREELGMEDVWKEKVTPDATSIKGK